MTPTGPTSGYMNRTYYFTSSIIDSNKNNIAYQFDWGDGSLSNWSDYLSSDSLISMGHSYDSTGTYEIKVKAKDISELESDWSSSHSITISIISILNGDFDDGFSNWELYCMNDAEATAMVENGYLKLYIIKTGSYNYNIQVSQGGLDLVQGRDYRLTFDAWADAKRTLKTSIWENGHDVDGNGFAWSPHGIETYEITTTKSRYSFTFTMALTNHDAGLAFFCGDSDIDLYIDNVSFVEL